MLRPSGIVTLTTDFGTADSYVAEMKGVLLSLAPRSRIVDVTHEIPKFDVRRGSYVLACTAPMFPKGTVHLAVVDPGVGSSRAPIAMRTKRSWLVGPDNGLLEPAAQAEGIVRVVRIGPSRVSSQRISRTFHGRDLFAPAAASLVQRGDHVSVGETVRRWISGSWAEATWRSGRASAVILSIDSFGNVVTSLRANRGLAPRGWLNLNCGGRKQQARWVRSYAEGRQGELVAIEGSHGWIELSIRGGSAAKRLRVREGDLLTMSVPESD